MSSVRVHDRSRVRAPGSRRERWLRSRPPLQRTPLPSAPCCDNLAMAEPTVLVPAIVGPVGTWVAIYYVVKQLRSARRIAQADFMLRTQNDFLGSHSWAYARFMPELGEWAGEKQPILTPEERAAVQHYLDFFNTLQIVREQGLVALETVDRMFAYRFFIVAHSRLGAKEAEADRPYFMPLFRLYPDWVEFREARGKPIYGRHEPPAQLDARSQLTASAQRWERLCREGLHSSTDDDIGVRSRLRRRVGRRLSRSPPRSRR